MLICIDDELVLGGFSDRSSGLSKGNFKSLNLGFNIGDDEKNVVKNRSILQHRLGAKKAIFMDQIHSDKICEISSNLCSLEPCDAVITDLKNVLLCVLVTDCSPILIMDKSLKKIAVVHAGRAGILQKILTKTILKMNSDHKNLEILIGPNIKRNCYEIGDLDLGEFNKFKIENGFDMNLALESEMLDLGIKNYKFSEICSHCDDRYFSYRRYGKTGRFCGFIMLKG